MSKLRAYIFVLISFAAQAQPGFIENLGQWDKNVLYKMDIPSGSLFLEDKNLTYTFYREKDVLRSKAHHGAQENTGPDGKIVHYHCYKVKFINTENPAVTAENPYGDYYNYFIGRDRSKWASNVKKFKSVFYKNLYKNIDYQIYINNKDEIQYDFLVNPGGNPEDIRIVYEGQDALYVSSDGSLNIVTSVNKVTELKPSAFQLINGKKITVPCNFMERDGKVAFVFPKGYNSDYQLIIDPVLIFSTYSGSTTDNWGFTATFDDQSNVFSGGIIFSSGYPVSTGAYQVNYAGGEYVQGYNGCDIALIKYDATGVQRLWATYLGGTVSEEMPHSLVSNRTGDLIIFGTTGSSDFPTSTNAWNDVFMGGPNVLYDNVVSFGNGTDIFVSILSSDGSQLLASTLIGGTDNDGFNFRPVYSNFLMHGSETSLYYNYADGARGEVICDKVGNIYVGTCTFSSDFPVTPGSFGQSSGGNQEGVVFKFNPNLSQLLFSSYFGGSNDDAIYSLDLDVDGNVYFAGGTQSANIPVTPGVFQPNFLGGNTDGFVAKTLPDGSGILYSTYVGSVAYDQVFFVRVDKAYNVYVTGQTKATGNTFIYNAIYGTPGSGQFITKFQNNLSSRIWSTAFGTNIGRPNISLTAFSVDYCNRVYLAGWGREWAGSDGYTWASIQGTKNMQVTPNAYQPNTDGQDFYLMVLSDDASQLEYATFFGEQQTGSSYCGHDHVDGGTSRFDKRGYIYESVCASCGNLCNGFPTAPNPGVWSPNNGGYNINQWICNNAVFKFSFELPLTIADFMGGPVCMGDSVHFTNTSQLATAFYWDFGDGTTSVDFEPTHLFTTPGFHNVQLIVSHPTSCNLGDTTYRTVVVENMSLSVSNDTSICTGSAINLNASATGAFSNITYHWSHYSDFSDMINTNPNNGNIIVTPSQTTTYYIQASSMICQKVDSVTVVVGILYVTSSPDTIICENSQISVNVTNYNPTDTLTYYWWPMNGVISGQNTSTLLVQPAQTIVYYVSVTNQLGCTGIDSVEVEVDEFMLAQGILQNPACFGICNGQISVIGTDGYLPYSYNWSNSEITPVISGLCEGSYSVTTTDAVGCSGVLNFTLTQPPLLTAVINALTTASCDYINPNTGSAVVTPAGGTPDYNYSWSNFMTDSLIVNLYAGHYIVTVTDLNGCTVVMETDITDQSNLAVQTYFQPTQCYGSCDGTAGVTVTFPGTPPYTYAWNTGSPVPNIDSLCAGIYWISVTDSTYCVRVGYVYVTQPDTIRAVITSPGIACFGGQTTATASVASGGTPVFTYEWSTGATGNTVSNLTPGTYWVYVTDSHGCKDTTQFTLTEPEILNFNSATLPVICSVACNGSVIVNASGGTPLYQYSWSNGSTASTLNNVCTGDYFLTITDNNGCSLTSSFNVGISDYLPLVDATTNTPYIYYGQSANLYAIANSGYQFSWLPAESLNGMHIQNPVASPTMTTTYQVIVQDSWGCSNTDTVTIFVLDVTCSDPFIYVPNAFTPNGDGKNDILFVQSDIVADLYFAIYDRWGEKVFETTNILKGWDGKYKGKALDPAVFVYYLKATCINYRIFEKKGNITLIR